MTTKSLRRHLLATALLAIGLGVSVGSGHAGSFTRGCAARDLQILMLIEEREQSRSVSPQTLSDALLAMLEARLVCYEGHVVDALAAYDDIARGLAPRSDFGGTSAVIWLRQPKAR
jgi:hypothetical protein